MTEKNTEKKEFFIFLLIAYGVTYLMGLLMWYGNRASIDLSAFPNAQMMYPASGVMLAYLLADAVLAEKGPGDELGVLLYG